MTDKLREKLINGGRVLVDEGQGDYVWGHISARLADDPNKFLMKPGCVGIEEMTDDNIITVNIEGDKVSGDWPRHNEVFIHSEVMRALPGRQLRHPHPSGICHCVLLARQRAQPDEQRRHHVLRRRADLLRDHRPHYQPGARQGGRQGARPGWRGDPAQSRHRHRRPTVEEAVFLAIKLERACRIQMLAEQAGGPKLFVKEEELVAKRGRTNRGNSQGNAFSYLVRRWHLRCGCEVPKEYQATLDNFDRTGYKAD